MNWYSGSYRSEIYEKKVYHFSIHWLNTSFVWLLKEDSDCSGNCFGTKCDNYTYSNASSVSYYHCNSSIDARDISYKKTYTRSNFHGYPHVYCSTHANRCSF